MRKKIVHNRNLTIQGRNLRSVEIKYADVLNNIEIVIGIIRIKLSK